MRGQEQGFGGTGDRSFLLPLRNSGETPDDPKTIQTHPDLIVPYVLI